MHAMPDLLTCQKITKAFGAEPLFEEFDLSIREKDRLGMIGPNGAGKSTLLKIMAGIEKPDQGSVIIQKGVRCVYMPQMSDFDPNQTVLAAVRENAKRNGHYHDETEIAAVVTLDKLGFQDPDATVATLSGGWRKRLTLACGLTVEPDLLLLDEPTNHLDLEGVLWLENLLAAAPFAWVLVTHDRVFLERTVARIAEINGIYPESVLAINGNYSVFLEKRKQYLDSQEKYKEALAGKVRRETEWLQKGPKARTTKARYRVNAAQQLIDELDRVKTREESLIRSDIDFSSSQRKTKKLVELKAVAKTMGDKKIANNLDLVLSPRMKLGILGQNGSGKTTLLKLINKQRDADRGEVRHAPNLNLVYFDQGRSQLDPNQSLREALSETGDSVIYQDRSLHVVTWARLFRFTNDQLPLPVGELSGGEQARLLIARLMLMKADVLLLDEPTNDLDIPTMELLEESLTRFAGALVLVTHDRYLLSRVCHKFIGLDGMGGHGLFADYGQWERSLKGEQTKDKKTPVAKSKPKKKKAKLGFKERHEFEGMEQRILVAEDKLESCRATAEDPTIASDGQSLMQAHEALAQAQLEVDRLYERWAELAALAE